MPSATDPLLRLTADSTASLRVTSWPDEVIDAVGQHPCSSYVETFWLGILGPSTTWLLRHLVTTLEAAPDGFDLPMADTARRLGLSERPGRNSPFIRAITRIERFALGHFDDERTLAVRLRVPPLTRTQVARLPELLQVAHGRWQEEQLHTPALEVRRQRVRQLALSYLEAGLGGEECERQLMRLGHHPAMCSDAVRWAMSRHEAALSAPTPLRDA